MKSIIKYFFLKNQNRSFFLLFLIFLCCFTGLSLFSLNQNSSKPENGIKKPTLISDSTLLDNNQAGVLNFDFNGNSFNKSILKLFNNPNLQKSPVTFSADERFFVFQDSLNVIRFFDLTTGNFSDLFIPAGQELSFLAFSHDGTKFAYGGELFDNAIKIWDMINNEMLISLFGHKDRVLSVEFSPDGNTLVSGSMDKSLKIWNIETGEIIVNKIYSNWVSSVSYSPDGNLIACGNWNSKIYIISANDGLSLKSYSSSSKPVLSAVFSDDGKLFTAGRDNKVSIWNTATDDIFPMKSYNETEKQINHLQYSIKNKVLAIGDGNGDINFLNTSNYQNIKKIGDSLGNSIIGMKLSPDETLIAVSYRNGSIIVFNIADINLNGKIDNDYDGIPDSLENTIGLNSTMFFDKFFDFDGDGLINTLEYYLESNITSIDTDSDLMGDYFEFLYGLKINSDDSFEDKDGDGLKNIIEYNYSLNPDDPVDIYLDLDNDGISNGYEIIIGLDPTNSTDAGDDKDLDGMSNLYESQNNLIPTFNDSYDDKDKDGMYNLWEYRNGLLASDPTDKYKDLDGDNLTNYEEFIFNSSANSPDSDDDGMSDLYEFLMSLDPQNPLDAADDLDSDGVSNLLEFEYGLNARNPNDVFQDHDGDYVITQKEILRGTDPFNILSFPLDEFSFFHRIIVALIVILISITFLIIIYNLRKKSNLKKKFNAPSYPKALLIKELGYESYNELVKHEKYAKNQMFKGIEEFYSNNEVLGIEIVEAALSDFERLRNHLLIAEATFNVSYLQMEIDIFSQYSSILQRFPKTSLNNPGVKFFDLLIRAMIEEKKENWGLARDYWKNALIDNNLDMAYFTVCQGRYLEAEFRTWSESPSIEKSEQFMLLVDEWLDNCLKNQFKHFTEYAKGKLFQSKVYQFFSQFNNASVCIDEAILIAEKNGLKRISQVSNEEKREFMKRLQEIYKNDNKTIASDEELQDYIKRAKNLAKSFNVKDNIKN